MTVETLRRAAALMRERAEAATQGPWEVGDGWVYGDPLPGDRRLNSIASKTTQADTEHIASWDPTVTSEVAKLLQAKVDYWVDGEGPCLTLCIHMDCEATNALLPLARAFLKEAGDDA